jgi:potassium-dependent mechanosensitive channel
MIISSRCFCLMLSVFLLAWCLVLAGPLKAQEKPGPDPGALLKVLTEGAASLEKDIAAGKAEADAVQQRAEQADAGVQSLRARIAALKASQAAGELQLDEAQETLESFAKREKQVAARLKEAREAREKLATQLADRTKAFEGLKQEAERLKAAKHPVWDSREVRQAYDRYQPLAKQYQTTATRVLELWDQVIFGLAQESQALSETAPELKHYLDAGRKAELLKRQPPAPLVETMTQTWRTLWELPERLATYLTDPKLPQKITVTLQVQWAQLFGILTALLALAWIAPRARRSLLPRLRQWQTEVEDWGLKVIFKAGEIIFAHLFGLGFLAWLALAAGIMGWWQRGEARIILLGVAVWVGLRLGFKLIQAVFAGREWGGILPFEESTVRSYRRHLKLLLVYVLVIEIFGLHLLQLLDLEATKYVNLETLIEAGFMIWVWWLLGRRYLENLRPELPGPAWTRVRVFFLTVRTLILLVLAAILLTSLLGFQNLSAYIAKGASLTGLLLVLFWVTWQVARAVLDHALYPKEGLAPGEIGPQDEVLRKYSLAIAKVVVTVIVFGVFFLILKLWGIDLGFLQLFSQGLTWGPTLGPFSLNLLNLGLVVLTLFLGRWFSRFLRALLEARFYPRTDWDESIRYTISNTCHYIIQAVAILLALGFLGVSFGHLAIVAGGLGVGIGFGLQNIVNNFISGLILLFERPIKVGDMLVIDGQWGLVKEIRVRSTIFQTFDRYVLIIPNSELISTKVANWTYYGPGINRLTLKIGVSYGSDVRQVTKVLDEVCRANPRVLAEPPPNIFFEAYGDSSLDFNIWVHVNSPADRIPATHELNSAIFEAFQELGIEIPFPQRDLYVKSWPGPPSVPASPPESKA